MARFILPIALITVLSALLLGCMGKSTGDGSDTGDCGNGDTRCLEDMVQICENETWQDFTCQN